MVWHFLIPWGVEIVKGVEGGDVIETTTCNPLFKMDGDGDLLEGDTKLVRGDGKIS